MNTQKQKIEELRELLNHNKQELRNLDISITNLADDEKYADWLDEIEGDVSILGMNYRTSYVLNEIDPIAYNCVFSDYLDSLEIEDSLEFKELTEKIEEIESELEEIESELEEGEQW